jgi:predicted cupin superfamily sugar epimerase
VNATVLGADLKAGQRPQGVVPKDAWQAARYLHCHIQPLSLSSRAAVLTCLAHPQLCTWDICITIRALGKWTLVSCTVAPAFQFSGFTLAPPEWAPGKPLP